MRNVISSLVLSAVLVPTAFAGTITATMTRGSLTNVNDAAGIWQIEGGTVQSAAGASLGQYACTRRTVTVGAGGTSPQNTAMLTCTIFMQGRGGSAPENITVQGAHDYSSGNFKGSVSAASAPYSHLIGADVMGETGAGTITFTW